MVRPDACWYDHALMLRKKAQSKIFPDADAALSGVLFEGMTLMSGGFGLVGNPETLIAGVLRSGVGGLTVISNNCGADGFGLWTLLDNGQIRKMISSYIGENKLFAELYQSGKLELELTPGHPGRADPGRRSEHSGVLHTHRCRDGRRRRQTGRGARRASVPARHLA